MCTVSPVQICHMFHFYKLQPAKSVSGFPNIFEIAGERTVSSHCTLKWCSHQTNPGSSLVGTFFQSRGQAVLLLFEDVSVNCTSSVWQIAFSWWEGNAYTHVSAISRMDYDEKSQHIIKIAQSFGILYMSHLMKICMFIPPSDKLPIKLKLMINLLEGMHTSNPGIHIREVATYEIQTEFQKSHQNFNFSYAAILK